MSRINDLTEQQCKLLEDIYLLNEDSQEDDEELQNLFNKLSENHKDIISYIEWMSKVYVEMVEITEGRREVSRKATARLRSSENKKDRLKYFILDTMKNNNLQKIKGKEHDLRLQLTPGTLVFEHEFDYSSLPNDCVQIIPEQVKPIASEVKRMIKDHPIDGISLVKETIVVIK
jgi:uncharacterized membrane protein YkoI